jgi:hypothetical protein
MNRIMGNQFQFQQSEWVDDLINMNFKEISTLIFRFI